MNETAKRARIIGLVVLVAFLLILNALWDEGDVTILDLDVPVWLVAFACYMLGIVAGWAGERSRSSA